MDPDNVNHDYAHETTIRMYEKMKTGDIPLQDYQMYLISLLESYIKQIISQHHFAAYAEFEDLMQEGRSAIIAMSTSYDPNRTRPTSYFTEYIKQYMRESLNSTVSKHYCNSASQLNRVAKDNGYTGLDDPDLDPGILSVLSGIPRSTVIKTMELMRQTSSSYEECSDNLELESGFKSPEEFVIEQERKDELYRVLKKLTPFERYLIYQVADNNKDKTSLRFLIRKLKDPAIAKRFQDELPAKFDQNFLQQIINKAYLKIRRNPNAAKYFDQNVQVFTEFEEQITPEEIENAFKKNDLILDL